MHRQLPVSWATLDACLAGLSQEVLAQLPSPWGDTYPVQGNVFRAFAEVSPADLRVVILGMDPYPTPGHAIGRSFAVPAGTQPLSKTLINIIREFEADVGQALPSVELDNWVAQGVLMANAALTMRGVAGAHQKLWAPFTAAWIRALQAVDRPCVWVLWGKDAQSFRGLITGGRQRVIEAPHPSPLAAYRGFFGSRPFSTCNKLLADLGCPPVQWA